MRRVVKLGLGRFGVLDWMGFFRQMSEINKASHEPTVSELAKTAVEDSISRDLKPKVKPHEHGLDVKSIATERVSELEASIDKELVEKEIKQLEAEVAVLESWTADRKKRLRELSGERGAVGYARQDEIEKARLAREEKDQADGLRRLKRESKTGRYGN